MTNRTEEKLALLGGTKLLDYEFKKYNSIGEEEIQAATNVLRSGVLSDYIADWDQRFFGGPKVQEFENAICEYFDVKHAISVNSWTSGLVAAVGAIGVEPGDEIIVTPWTMSASATAIMHWNAIPVFADIDRSSYNIDPTSIEKNISSKTKAIMSVDIFGRPADADPINQLAKKYDLKVISDSAQAPGAKYKGRYAGTVSDIGGFSLNYHKHIHTGEGGVLVTDNDEYAERMQLIRNHAEVVLAKKKYKDLTNMLGHNFRLGEIECAIAIEQLKKLPKLIASRQKIAEKLIDGLKDLSGLIIPPIGQEISHVYYVFPLQIDKEFLGVSRNRICDAISAEGLGVSKGYQNIHLLPMYQNKQAYGSKGFPWSSEYNSRSIDYAKGICPVAESLHDFDHFAFGLCNFDLSEKDVDIIIQIFKKVWNNLESL